MKFITYPAGIYQANCYIVYDEVSGDGFIIDPGGDASGIAKILDAYSVKPLFMILTHGHFDHTGGVNELKNIFSIPAYINEGDNYLVAGGDKKYEPLPLTEPIMINKFVRDGDILYYGNETLCIIDTPGHSPGGITINTGGVLFTGDTLFKNSIGRTDLPGGSFELISDSIKRKLLVFPDETSVYPGHGQPTTIGFEKRYNPFF